MPSPLMWPGAGICWGVAAMADPFAVQLALSILLGLTALIVALLAAGCPPALVLSLLVGVTAVLSCPSPP